ncbi:hypothetical protein [Pseudomonas putida]|uniref:Uncharacterized protein n=1 Tax=Pseudomonas putida TaxID=303 RepID=A0A8I1ED36_PSEPU|nr:hypothetical protein [Pseudomonas putida]MBI6883053.1 hypothetical protein [Pseudomonas putida]
MSCAETVFDEGWALFDVDGSGLMEIQRDDELDVFETDDDAIAHVLARSEQGSLSHRRALALHMLDAPLIVEIRTGGNDY